MAGRKKQMGVPREPNGRKSRRKDFRDHEKELVKRPMEQARARVHGIPAEHAKDPKAETVIGRYCLRGEVSDKQWQAADQYAKQARAYSMAVNAPKQMGAVVLEASTGGVVGDETEYEAERATKARQRFSDAMRAVVDADMMHGGVSRALAMVVLEDKDAPDSVGLVRIGLNALARHYRING